MDTVIAILAIIAGVVGIIGSILPGLPGPPLGWVGMLLLYLWGGGTARNGEPMGLTLLLIMLAVPVVVSILDYAVPSYFTRKTGGSKAGARGSLIGLFIGMFFFPPWGILIGAMGGAFAAELLLAQKSGPDALRSAWGAFLGFISGTGLKLASTCIMFYYIIIYAF